MAAASAGGTVLHPLLHRNTSDLSEQRYSTTFSGEEFYLRDHQVNGEKVLPAAAYLEMARAAMRQAWPGVFTSDAIELHGIYWLQPLLIREPKEVMTSVFIADEGEIGFEIYDVDAGEETIHCQGFASLPDRQPAHIRIEPELFNQGVCRNRLSASTVYSMLAGMQLQYGPAHQGVSEIRIGDKEVLAHLRLPPVVAGSENEYVLHPSLLDSALQASVGLIDSSRLPAKPLLPFVLERLRVVAPCKDRMLAWVRHSQGGVDNGATLKVDVELCDLQGSVCVQLMGCASRVLSHGAQREARRPDALVGKDGRGRRNSDQHFDVTRYRQLIADVANGQMSVSEAVELG